MVEDMDHMAAGGGCQCRNQRNLEGIAGGENMKKNIYLTILTIVTMVCMIAGIFSHVFGGFFGKNTFLQNSTGEQADWSTALDSFQTIRMNLAAANVVLERGDDFSIAYTGAEELVPDYSVDGDVLKITNEKNNKKIYTVRDCTLTVTLPEGADLAELNARINAGEIQIRGIDAENLDVEIDAGNVEVSNGSYTHVSMDVDAGNVTVDNCTVINTSAEVNMGNIEFKNCAFDALDATSDMGNIEIDSSQPLDGYEVRMSADLGNVTVNGKSYSGGYNAAGDSEYCVDLTVNLGNVELRY
jgi:hypothetical protein